MAARGGGGVLGVVAERAAGPSGRDRVGGGDRVRLWPSNQRRGGMAALTRASSWQRRTRSASGMTSAACSASAVALMSYGLTSSASDPSSSAAPASADSTTAQPWRDRIGASLATRFMPSLIGLTSSTSASTYAASDRAKSSNTSSISGCQSGVPNSSLITAASRWMSSV